MDQERRGLEPTGKKEEQQREAAGFATRRTILASIGMAGAAAAASYLMPLGTAYGKGHPVHEAVYGNGRGEELKKPKAVMEEPSCCCIPITVAELRAAASLQVDALYYVTDAGREGPFRCDPLDVTSPDNTGTVLVASDGTRVKRIITDDVLNVRWFGAKGDGVTDDTSVIQLADNTAAAMSKRLFFPEGTYMAYGLLITTSWFAHGRAVVMNNAPTNNKYNFVRMVGMDSLSLEGMTFDGAVSADPVAWNSSNYNAFTGALAFYLYNSTRIRLSNCTFRNSVMSSLRIERCSSVIVENCAAHRSRGNFGDGFYASASDHVRFDRCRAEDYTRIGFVCEQGSWHMSFSQCFAKDGHDQSKLYGGAEYNAGFWSENTENVTYSQCVAEQNTHCGFTVAPGVNRPYKTPVAPYVLDSCVAIGNGLYGIVASDSKADRFAVTCSNCFVFGSRIGLAANVYHMYDTVTIDNCYFKLEATALGQNVMGILLSGNDQKASVRVSRCLFDHASGDPSLLASKTATSGDITVFNNTRLLLSVDDCGGVDAEQPLILKALLGTTEINVRNCLLDVVMLKSFVEARFDWCRFAGAANSLGDAAATGDVYVSNCAISGAVEIRTAGRIRVDITTAKLTSTQQIQIVRNTDNRDILTTFADCRFEKNIAASGPAIRIEEQGAAKPASLFRDCVFYNAGGTSTAIEPFVWSVHAGTTALFTGCYADDTVPNVLKTGTTLSTPAGSTSLPLH